MYNSSSFEALVELCKTTSLAADHAIRKVTNEWLPEEHRGKGVHLRAAVVGMTDHGAPWFFELFNTWVGGLANHKEDKYPLYVANSAEKAWRLLRNFDSSLTAYSTWSPENNYSWPGAIAVKIDFQIEGLSGPVYLLLSCSGVPWEGDEACCVETALEVNNTLDLGMDLDDLRAILECSENSIHPGIPA